MDKLTIKNMEMLEKKPRQKQAHSEYSTDPVTGLRSNKGTSSGQVSKKRKKFRPGVKRPNLLVQHEQGETRLGGGFRLNKMSQQIKSECQH